MKKQLRFIYRYFISSHRWRKLFNRQTALVLLATAAFFTTLAWTAPRHTDREMPRAPQSAGLTSGQGMDVSAGMAQATPIPTALAGTDPTRRPTPTRTPFPAEFYENADQTIGITLAGALLVLIVVLGTLTLMPRKK